MQQAVTLIFYWFYVCISDLIECNCISLHIFKLRVLILSDLPVTSTGMLKEHFKGIVRALKSNPECCLKFRKCPGALSDSQLLDSPREAEPESEQSSLHTPRMCISVRDNKEVTWWDSSESSLKTHQQSSKVGWDCGNARCQFGEHRNAGLAFASLGHQVCPRLLHDL